MNDYEKANRERLIKLVLNLPVNEAPQGWKNTGKFAVGGLREIGFSKRSELLLVVSISGRGVIDGTLGNKIARDEEGEGDWYEPAKLLCLGIGPLQDEHVQIAGLHGGGLPTSNSIGESLDMVSHRWPKSDLIFCPPSKSALIEGHQAGCVTIASDYIRAFGFSWSGNSFAYATESDVTVYSRQIV